jgi:chromosomal replication initiator protein
MRVVAAHYGLKVSELKEKSNARTKAFPRQVAMYMCKELTDLSYPEIGKIFNNKHHSTVMYSVEKIDQLIQDDQQVARTIEMLTKQFR